MQPVLLKRPRQLIGKIDCTQAALAMVFGPVVGGEAVEVGSQDGGVEGFHAVGEECGDEAGEDIARAGGGEGGVAGLVYI